MFAAGTVAVVSLMTGGIVARETDNWLAKSTSFLSTTDAERQSNLSYADQPVNLPIEMENDYKLKIAISVAFITGMAQVGGYVDFLLIFLDQLQITMVMIGRLHTLQIHI